MKAKIDIVSTPTADTPGTCLLLEFDDKLYLVGRVHEGCQRAVLERGKRMIKVTDIFVTGTVEWANTGGLMGLMITSADSKTAANQAAQQMNREKQQRRLEMLRRNLQQAKPDTPKYVKIIKELDEETRRQQQQEKEPIVPQPMGIHGGRNLMHTVATCRRFVFRRGMPLNVYETKADTPPNLEKPTWSDSNMDVFAMPILPRGRSDKASMEKSDHRVLEGVVNDMFNSNWSMDALYETRLADVQMPAAIFVRNGATNKLEKYKGPRPGDKPAEALPDIKVLVRKPWPAANVRQLPPTTPSPVSTSYVFRCHSQRGKFLPDAAKKLGVPTYMFKNLTFGETITLEDGTVVRPDQVMEPSRPGGAFAAIDIPSSEYIDATLERPEWSSPLLMDNLRAVVWILGPGVAEDARLAEFIKARQSAEHIVSSPDHMPNSLAFRTSAELQIRLANVDDERHPVPDFDDTPKELPSPLQNCHAARPGHVFHLEPRPKWDASDEVQFLNCAKVMEEMPAAILDMGSAAKRAIQDGGLQAELRAQTLPGLEAEIITLGTGSAAPSKHRNTSATLLRVPGYGSYLFDAGENTMGQLSRVFRAKDLKSVLQDLRMIWISHMHADHHLGTTSVIRAWSEANHGVGAEQTAPARSPNEATLAENPREYLNRSRLFVASDERMIQWLKEYSAAEDFGLSRVVLMATAGAAIGDPASTGIWWGGRDLRFNGRDESINAALREATGLVNMQTAPVDHCTGAQAVSLSFADGFKVSYSGDCRPSQRFIEIGKGSTVLIHEATFNDELQGDALAKKHSTISEAVKVGMEMGAPRIMLTHFSQRYSKIPSTDNIERYHVKFQDTVGDDPGDDFVVDAADVSEGNAQQGSLTQDGSQPRLESKKSSASLRSVGKTRGRPSDVKIGVAFDYMRVKVKDMAVLEKFHPAINALMESESTEEKKDIEEETDQPGEAPKKEKASKQDKASQWEKDGGMKKRKRGEAQNKQKA